MTVFLFVSLLVMLAASVPIFIALCGSVTASFLLFSNMDTTIIIQRMFAGINKFSLMSIPLFVLAANLMSEGGISKRIINLANAFVGHIPGGLGMTAILASMFFGAISGSSPATVVAIGALLYPAMIEKGYSKEFSAGVITAAGSLGIIIPPSVNMIVYGTVTGASVGALFMSGFGAGIVYGLSFIPFSTQNVIRRSSVRPERPGASVWLPSKNPSGAWAFRSSSWAVSTAACLLQPRQRQLQLFTPSLFPCLFIGS